MRGNGVQGPILFYFYPYSLFSIVTLPLETESQGLWSKFSPYDMGQPHTASISSRHFSEPCTSAPHCFNTFRASYTFKEADDHCLSPPPRILQWYVAELFNHELHDQMALSTLNFLILLFFPLCCYNIVNFLTVGLKKDYLKWGRSLRCQNVTTVPFKVEQTSEHY